MDTTSTQRRVAVTDELAGWAAASDPAGTPARVLDHARLLLLDGFGCGLFGSGQPWARIVRELAGAGGDGPATVWGSPTRVPVTMAPLANGTAVHAFEYDDLHPRAVFHAGSQVLPAAMAVTEMRAGEGGYAPSEREWLHAIVVGFEVGARIGMATGTGQLARGFHPSPNTGTFAAAATAARLLGLDAERTAHAFGIAGSFGGYLMAAQYGAMVKRVHAGHAAQSGVVAAMLAARDLTGTAAVLETPYGGFATTYADASVASVNAVTDELGQRWETAAYSLKYYPCCGSNHTSIDAWWAIREQAPDLTAEDIDTIEVACSTLTYDHVGWPYLPDSVTTAQMNLGYCLAAAVVDGCFTLDQVRPERLADPGILDLVRRIRVRASEAIDALGRERRHYVEVTVTARDGRRLVQTCEYPRGSSRRPLEVAEVVEKFRLQAGAVLDPMAVEALEQYVLTLGTSPDAELAVDSLGQLLSTRATAMSERAPDPNRKGAAP